MREPLTQSVELQSACPASAVVMREELQPLPGSRTSLATAEGDDDVTR